MNTDDFDLNIANYSLIEVENFMKVKAPYSLNDVLKNEKMIVDVISKDPNYPVDKKSRFIEFMKQAKLRLTRNLRKQLDKTIQNEQELPDEDVVVQQNAERLVNKVSVTESGGNSFVQHPETVTFNDIINKEKRLNPVESYPTDIARGDLNKLKRKVYTQTLVLNSVFRQDYRNTQSTDFSLELPYQFKNVLSLKLSSIQLPNVIYCFSKEKMNNLVFLKETGDGEKREGTIVLPDGNYNITALAETLQKCINEQLDINPPRFFVDADTAAQKLTIRNIRNTFDMNFLKDVNSKDFNSTLGWLLGFRKKNYECSATYFAEAVYVGTSTDYVFFVLNDFNNSQTQSILAMYSQSYIGDNILAMIPISSNSVSQNNFLFDAGNLFLEKKREYFGPVNLQRFKIELRNQYGEIVDLNETDFSFSLEVEIGYDW